MSHDIDPKSSVCDLAKPRGFLNKCDGRNNDAVDRHQDAMSLDATDTANHPVAGILDTPQSIRIVFRHADAVDDLIAHSRPPKNIVLRTTSMHVRRIDTIPFGLSPALNFHLPCTAMEQTSAKLRSAAA